MYRFERSWCASGPVQIAAVIAARLTPCEPNGASTSDASPVVAISGAEGVV